MIYVMECNKCEQRTEIVCRLVEHAVKIKPGYQCVCGGYVRQVITPPTEAFAREAFPKGDPRWEHATDEPIHIRDHIHLRDICQENGNISRYLEDRA